MDRPAESTSIPPPEPRSRTRSPSQVGDRGRVAAAQAASTASMGRSAVVASSDSRRPLRMAVPATMRMLRGRSEPR